MTHPISIGTREDGSTIPIDLAALRDSRLIVTGNSGAGKSRTLRRLIEQTHGQIQQVIFDPEDEFFTLREQFDFVLTGGEDGDCPTCPASAVALAQKVLELNLNIVIGLDGLELVERFEFVFLFIRTLINAPKAQRRPIMVVVDEADIYAPEGCESAKPGNSARGDAGLAMVDLAIRGRKRGLVMVLATNRVSLVSATVRSPCVSKLVGRQSMDIDVDRAGKDLGLKDKAQLRHLTSGTFFATGPAFGLNASVEKILVGPVVTTHPSPGSHAPPAPPPRAQIAKILAQLAELGKVDSPEAAPALTGPCRSCAALVIERDGLRESNDRAVKAMAEETEARYYPLVEAVLRLSEIIPTAKFKSDWRSLPMPHAGIDVSAPAGKPVARIASPAEVTYTGGDDRIHKTSVKLAPNGSSPSKPIPAGDQKKLDRCGRALLSVLASRGDRGANLRQLAVLSGYSRTSSGFANSMSALRTAGLASGRGDDNRITEAGMAAIGDNYDRPRRGRELREYWFGKLDKAERTLLGVLVGNPRGVDKESLAELSGYSITSSGFANACSKLRTLELADPGWPMKPSQELL